VGFEDHLGHVGLSDVVLVRPPGREGRGEHLERLLDRHVDGGLALDRRDGGCGHGCSCSGWEGSAKRLSVGGLLGGLLEVGQRLVPHAFQPGAHGGDAVRVEPVDAAGALGLGHDQATVAEHLEVLGDGGTADRQLVGQLLHRRGPAGEQFEDGATGRVAEQTQPRISVSRHKR
jgi:hypothetical protein